MNVINLFSKPNVYLRTIANGTLPGHKYICSPVKSKSEDVCANFSFQEVCLLRTVSVREFRIIPYSGWAFCHLR